MLATGDRNATLSLDSRKILSCAIWGKYTGPAGEAPVQREENAFVEHKTGGEQRLPEKGHKGKRFIFEHSEGGRTQNKMTAN